MSRTEKPLDWLKGHVKTPPSKDARIEAGYLLRQLQNAVFEKHSRRRRMRLPSECSNIVRNDSGTTMMRAGKKKKRRESREWAIGDAADFLQLSPDDSAYVEVKLKLSRSLRKQRQQRKWTQQQLATRIESSQSRVAKIEAGDPSVSLDLIVRSLLALGTRCETSPES